MSGQPFFKFFPTDWRADPCLQRCTWAARGLWMEMVCIMHENKGFLAVGGVPLTVAELARMCGGPEDEAHALLAELERAGVFSRDEAGTIFSRRILRDIARSVQNSANGKRGGNPRLRNGDKRHPNPPLKRNGNPPLKRDSKPYSARLESESLTSPNGEDSDDRASPRGAGGCALVGAAASPPFDDDQETRTELQTLRDQITARFVGQQRLRILAKLDRADTDDPIAYGHRCLAAKPYRKHPPRTAKVEDPEMVEIRALVAAHNRRHAS